MATRLFIGNLPENTQEKDLVSAFSNYGEVKNLDLKSKSAADSESKTFAFVTLSGTNFNIESCIKHFSNENFNGKRLYVTRARESFLERLQRERAEAQLKQKVTQKEHPHENPQKQPVIKLGDKLNPRKRKLDNHTVSSKDLEPVRIIEKQSHIVQNGFDTQKKVNALNGDQKKQDSDKKRMEAMKKKREEFKTKQMIVKTGLTSVDKVQNKRVKFSDNEDDTPHVINGHKTAKTTKLDKKSKLFDDDDNNVASDEEFNFEIKKQYEGKKGQKVLDLQSRYKSDKRFVLDERFIDDEHSDGKENEVTEKEDQIEVNQANEKAKQLNILQDVLGVAIRTKIPVEENDKKNKHKLGMLRFDPTQPEHAKFLAPIEEIKSTKKSKKKKDKQTMEPQEPESKPEPPRPEVSKEQFYKVSETLKEAIAQPTSFSLRSLFGNTETTENEQNKDENYISLDTHKKTKVKHPLEPGEKNPFVYDSSESETEEPKEIITPSTLEPTENKAVWKENFFFSSLDQRFKDGLHFFNNIETDPRKERRELKSLMKKRIYNKDRKNQMFQKKIGGRKKTIKNNFRKKR